MCRSSRYAYPSYVRGRTRPRMLSSQVAAYSARRGTGGSESARASGLGPGEAMAKMPVETPCSVSCEDADLHRS